LVSLLNYKRLTQLYIETYNTYKMIKMICLYDISTF